MAGVRPGGYGSDANLLPQGPFATLLVDDQPYGMLPLTPLDSAAGGPTRSRTGSPPRWSKRSAPRRSLAAEERDTVVGADAERLLRVLGRHPDIARVVVAVEPAAARACLNHPDVAKTQAAAVAPYLNAAGQTPASRPRPRWRWDATERHRAERGADRPS